MCDESVKIKHIVVFIGMLLVMGIIFATPELKTEQEQLKATETQTVEHSTEKAANARDKFLNIINAKKRLKDITQKLAVLRPVPLAAAPAKSTGHMHTDTDGRPQLLTMVTRLNDALSKYFSSNVKDDKCFKGWQDPVKDSFLSGCGATQCKRAYSFIEEYTLRVFKSM